jgi:hypothetical protein
MEGSRCVALTGLEGHERSRCLGHGKGTDCLPSSRRCHPNIHVQLLLVRSSPVHECHATKQVRSISLTLPTPPLLELGMNAVGGVAKSVKGAAKAGRGAFLIEQILVEESAVESRI